LNKIWSIIEDRQAYIVPGVYNKKDEINLSISLGIPIMCGDPETTTIYSTKSGSKWIFHLAEVPTPISAYDIYTKMGLLNSLSKLILNNLFVNTWILKIDNEFNGRGHASFNVDGLKTVIDMWKKPIDINDFIIGKMVDILE